jgi:NADH-quinone oxidoreductase subunit J
MSLVDVAFVLLAAGAVVTGWLVFRTDSMMRAAFWLLASFAATGGIIVLLGAEFVGMVIILMVAGEMLIMAIAMVMYMMNPAGLNPMFMVHQHRVAIAAGIVAFVSLSAVALLSDFPDAPVVETTEATAELGFELLGDSMLTFQTAGVALLATMIGAVALSSRKGRYGAADEGSHPPELDPEETAGQPSEAVDT